MTDKSVIFLKGKTTYKSALRRTYLAANKALERKAEGQGVTVDELVTKVMNHERTPFKAAIALGVYPNTIYHYLKKSGWTNRNGEWKKTIYEKAS